MIQMITDWFLALSRREKILIGILGVLTIGIIGFYGIVKPFSNALDNSEQRFTLASERKARIESKVALLKAPQVKSPRQSTGTGKVPLDVLVSQSTGEAGFAVGRVEPQSDGSVNLTIESAKPTSLFGWLSRMEDAGVFTAKLIVNPAKSGTVEAAITMRQLSP